MEEVIAIKIDLDSVTTDLDSIKKKIGVFKTERAENLNKKLEILKRDN